LAQRDSPPSERGGDLEFGSGRSRRGFPDWSGPRKGPRGFGSGWGERAKSGGARISSAWILGRWVRVIWPVAGAGAGPYPNRNSHNARLSAVTTALVQLRAVLSQSSGTVICRHRKRLAWRCRRPSDFPCFVTRLWFCCSRMVRRLSRPSPRCRVGRLDRKPSRDRHHSSVTLQSRRISLRSAG